MSCNMKNLYVYNHEYQINKLPNLSEDDSLLKINNSEKELREEAVLVFRLLENVRFWMVPVFKALYIFKLKRTIMKSDRLVIFGCQDLLSNQIARYAIKKCIPVQVVPDNMEFYLRPDNYFSNKNSIVLFKNIFLGFKYSDLGKRIDFFNKRTLFSLPRGVDIVDSMAFYNVKESVVTKSSGIIFVSQPYYSDYNIDIVEWCSRIEEVAKIYGGQGRCFYIRFHQRDSTDFREMIKQAGIRVAPDGKDYSYVGIFSTFLFQLSLERRVVYSVFEIFSDLFPVNYKMYVERISKEFGVNLAGKLSWRIQKEIFIKKNKSVLVYE